MHKYLLPYLLFTTILSSQNNTCIEKLFKKSEPAYLKKYKKAMANDEAAGARYYVDSLQFSIARQYDFNDKLVSETISNDITDICFSKEFHENGSIKSAGYLTSDYFTPIGIWEHRSSNNNIDSIVNHDKKYKITFCEFYQMAEQRGLTGSTSNFRFHESIGKWEVNKWSYPKNKKPFYKGIVFFVETKKINDVRGD